MQDKVTVENTVYILCAFYAEAAELITEFNLKRVDTGLKCQVFENESHSLRLIITGTGLVAAAAASAAMCVYYGVNSGDRIINVGTCASEGLEVGTIVIANKIVNSASGRIFYPDMLQGSNLPEMTLVTLPRAYKEDMAAGKVGEESVEIYDMEAAAIYEAAIPYVSTHCLSFVKVVSDHGIAASDRQLSVTPANIKNIMRQAMPRLLKYIEAVMKESGATMNSPSNSEMSEVEDYVLKLSEDMRCSQTMCNQLRQLIKYAYLSGIEYRRIIEQYYSDRLLPTGNKNIGKQVLSELYEKII